ncbi:hypothetical protein Tco_1336499 [Tanacetum coccineum]
MILLPPLPLPSLPLPVSPTYPLGYRAAMIRLRAETPSTSHPLPSSTPPSRTLLPIPLPTSSPTLASYPVTDYSAWFSPSYITALRRGLCIGSRSKIRGSESSFTPTARPSKF